MSDIAEQRMQHIEALAEANALLLYRLKDVTRICEAVRYTSGLGTSQWERVAAAKKLIAEIERHPKAEEHFREARAE